ncbi:MAG: GTPase Era [Gemmatimonadota bacterium]|nr:GTPase Era [Gemmatimonadota bacterium]
MSSAADFKSGYIAIAGKANVGKSTLFNLLVGARLSIVTAKPQTTRHRVSGILTSPTSQMIFLDTPGLFQPRCRLHERMCDQIRRSVSDADVFLGVVDASAFDATFDREMREVLRRVRRPRIVAVNKSDLVSAARGTQCADAVKKEANIQDVITVSAQNGCNVELLLSSLEQALPSGPLFFPEDTLTEHPERFFVAELVREEIFLQLRQELPYATTVKVEAYREDRNRTHIRASIFVERQSQKGIVIGRNGKTLKSIGKTARGRIEAFLDAPVYLELRVKVFRNWRKKEQALRGFGY